MAIPLHVPVEKHWCTEKAFSNSLGQSLALQGSQPAQGKASCWDPPAHCMEHCTPSAVKHNTICDNEQHSKRSEGTESRTHTLTYPNSWESRHVQLQQKLPVDVTIYFWWIIPQWNLEAKRSWAWTKFEWEVIKWNTLQKVKGILKIVLVRSQKQQWRLMKLWFYRFLHIAYTSEKACMIIFSLQQSQPFFYHPFSESFFSFKMHSARHLEIKHTFGNAWKKGDI